MTSEYFESGKPPKFDRSQLLRIAHEQGIHSMVGAFRGSEFSARGRVEEMFRELGILFETFHEGRGPEIRAEQRIDELLQETQKQIIFVLEATILRMENTVESALIRCANERRWIDHVIPTVVFDQQRAHSKYIMMGTMNEDPTAPKRFAEYLSQTGVPHFTDDEAGLANAREFFESLRSESA